MRQQVSQRLAAAYDAAQQQAERYELQELSAVTTGDISSFCPRTAVNQQVLERVIRGITSFPGHVPPASQAARLYRKAPQYVITQDALSIGRWGNRSPSARWRWKGRPSA
jgi:hypothetical protein